MDVKFECSSLNVLIEIGKNNGNFEWEQLSNSKFNHYGTYRTSYLTFQKGPRRFLTRVDMTQNLREQNPINFVPSNSKLIAVHPQQHSILSHLRIPPLFRF